MRDEREDMEDNVSKSPLVTKSKAFAIRVVKMCKYLDEEKHEHIMRKQVVRSGTSIGANLAESQYAQSRDDFFTKITIALKEANETKYWLELLRDTDYLEPAFAKSIISDCSELIAMLVATSKSTKTRKC